MLRIHIGSPPRRPNSVLKVSSNPLPLYGSLGTLRERYFKQKDAVENYLAAQVKAGTMNLHDAQWGIANDRTQYLDASAGRNGSPSVRFTVLDRRKCSPEHSVGRAQDPSQAWAKAR
jgi:hypothetical protein